MSLVDEFHCWVVGLVLCDWPAILELEAVEVDCSKVLVELPKFETTVAGPETLPSPLVALKYFDWAKAYCSSADLNQNLVGIG